MSDLNIPLVCIDFETTGLKAGYNEIFQIAAIRVDENFNATDDVFQQYISIQYPDRFTQEAQNVTKITPDMLTKYPPQSVVRDMFVAWIKKISPVCQIIDPFGQNYYGFDTKFMEPFLDFDRTPEKSLFNRHLLRQTIDLRWKAMDFTNWLRPINELKFQTEQRHYKTLENNQLGTIAQFCGVINENAHSAIDDVKTTIVCYKRLRDIMNRGL